MVGEREAAAYDCRPLHSEGREESWWLLFELLGSSQSDGSHNELHLVLSAADRPSTSLPFAKHRARVEQLFRVVDIPAIHALELLERYLIPLSGLVFSMEVDCHLDFLWTQLPIVDNSSLRVEASVDAISCEMDEALV